MFDPNHRDAISIANLANMLDEFSDLDRRKPRGDFINEQQPRLPGERARQFKHFLFLQAQLVSAGFKPIFQADKAGKDFRRLHGVEKRGPRASVRAPDGDAFAHCELAEGTWNLVGAADAKTGDLVSAEVRNIFSVDEDFPGFRSVNTGDEVEQRCLAGAVGADEANDFALFDLQ